MKYQAKSVLIGRKKRHDKEDFNVRPCFISLFDENNPHLSTEGPKEVLEFEDIHKVIIEDAKVNYLLPGNDLIVNNLEHIEVEKEGPHLFVRGKHV